MTTQQRAEYVMRRIKEITLDPDNSPNQIIKLETEAIDGAITAAIEEDRKAREACAKVCDREAAIYAKGASPEDIHGYPSEFREVCNCAKRIAQEIRARSEGENKQEKGIEEMITEERLTKVYNLITAAHSLLNMGQMMRAIGLIQTARIIASHSDEFLELNKIQVEKDCEEALRIIQRSEGEKGE